MAEIGVVVVTWNSAATLRRCLESVPEGCPVVVVDNASSDETLAVAQAVRPGAHLLPLATNVGFGAACNRGAAQLEGADVLLLNPDAALVPGVLEGLANLLAQDPSLGAVGPLITDPDGTLELSWGHDPTLVTEWRRRQEHSRPPSVSELPRGRVDWVTGACCLVRRSVWDAVGGFDEGYFLYFEDLDLCRRIRERGYGVWFEPTVAIQHLRGASADALGAEKARRYRASQLRYYRRYASWLSGLGLRAYLVLKFLWAAWRHPTEAAAYRDIARLASSGRERS